MLNTNNKITNLVTSQQAIIIILTCLYTHYLDITKGHIATHTMFFKFKMALFFSFLVVQLF